MTEEIKTQLKPNTKVLSCYLDGNALCIVGPDFVNIQESKAMFIVLTPAQISEFNNLT